MPYGVAVTQTPDEGDRREIWTSPDRSVRARVAELRKQRGWTAQELADRCKAVGASELNRSVIANIESGRRKYVTVDEAAVLAYVLNVAPLHLLVPIEVKDNVDGRNVDAHRYLATPDRFLTIGQAREWFRGNYSPPGQDPRLYFSQVPREEWKPNRPSGEAIEEAGARYDLLDQLGLHADRSSPKEESDGR
jgi:transcriptional regulator with XRE-family HTH domain